MNVLNWEIIWLFQKVFSLLSTSKIALYLSWKWFKWKYVYRFRFEFSLFPFLVQDGGDLRLLPLHRGGVAIAKGERLSVSHLLRNALKVKGENYWKWTKLIKLFHFMSCRVWALKWSHAKINVLIRVNSNSWAQTVIRNLLSLRSKQ